MMRSLAFVALLSVAVFHSGSSFSYQEMSYRDSRYAMGTLLEITLVGIDQTEAVRLFEILYSAVERLEDIFSLYRPTSSLVTLNTQARSGSVSVPPELAAILKDGVRYMRLTRGAFDVTVGPLVDLWKVAVRHDRTPSSLELDEACAQVGSERLRIKGNRVEFMSNGMSINLDGLAKGYTLDLLRVILTKEGVENALLSFGESSTLALGAPFNSSHWRLFLRDPAGAFAGVIMMSDQALSVSGGLSKEIVVAGISYGHVINPLDGMPVGGVMQAAVLAASAADAEAWSKALLILGSIEGTDLIEEISGVESVLVDETGGRIATTGFDVASSFEPFE